MSPGKKPHSGALDEPIEDVKLIRSCMDALLAGEVEFPIRVEGARTLPYATVVKVIEHDRGQFLIRLVRPLPHELMAGAEFRMVFSVEDQRYEGLIVFRERDSYLQYRFDMPKVIQYSDRRRHRRHPFRPREKTFVTGLDGGIPGVGIAGPLANLCLDGCAIRLDRVLRMSDGMRIPINTGTFDKGKYFAKLRIQDLLKVPALNLTAHVAHLTEKSDGIILGLSFGDIGSSDQKLIGDTLDLRERMFRTTQMAATRQEASPRAARAKEAPEEPLPPSEPEVSAASLEPGPLLLLQRHSARLTVVVSPGEDQRAIQDLLQRLGYHRLQFTSRLDEAASAAAMASPILRPQAFVVDLRMGSGESGEPLAMLREVQRILLPVKAIPMFGLCLDMEPSLALEQSLNIRFGTLAPKNEAEWAASLDGLLGLEGLDSGVSEWGDPDDVAVGIHPE